MDRHSASGVRPGDFFYRFQDDLRLFVIAVELTRSNTCLKITYCFVPLDIRLPISPSCLDIRRSELFVTAIKST